MRLLPSGDIETMTVVPATRLIAWALLVALALMLLGAARGQATVQFDAASSQPSRLQLFHDRKGAFSESESDWLSLPAGAPVTQGLRLWGGGARWLRIDPAGDRVTRLCRWRIDGRPATFEVSAYSGLALARAGDCLVLHADAGAGDPQLVLRASGETDTRIRTARRWNRLLRVSLILSLALAVALAWRMRVPLGACLARLPMPRAWRLLETRLHLVAMAAMLLFGGAFVFTTPPGAVPDEQAHLAKAIRVAWGIPLGGQEHVRLPDLGANLEPFADLISTKRVFSKDELRNQLARPLRCLPDIPTGLHGADGYAPHQYALSALAFGVGCASGSSFGAFLHAARGLNLLLAALLVGWGVREARHGRIALVLVALLPMSLFEIASLSADSLVIGLSLAWLGLVSGIASGTRALQRVDAGLLGLAIAIALLKPGSAWILASFLFCRRRYGTDGAGFWKAATLYVFAPMVLHVVFTLAVGGSAPRLEGADPAANLALLRSNPLQVLQVLGGTVVDYGDWIVHATIGLLGWLDVPLAAWAYSLALALGLASLFADADTPTPVPAWVRPVALAFAVGAFVLLAMPLFIYWTPTGATRITSLQGRYFLPLAAFVLAWLSTSTPPAVRGWLSLFVLAGAAVLDAHALARLHDAYFITGR
jgi:uncharacterized membrane protein